MERGLWEQGFEGQHGCFMYHSDCKQAMCTHSLFLIIEPFLHNVNASMGEVYYGELIKGSEIGTHMACPWGIASIMAALGLVCTQRLRLNVKYVDTVIGYKDCDPLPTHTSSSIPLSERGGAHAIGLPLLSPRHHHYIIRLDFVHWQRPELDFSYSMNRETFWHQIILNFGTTSPMMGAGIELFGEVNVWS